MKTTLLVSLLLVAATAVSAQTPAAAAPAKQTATVVNSESTVQTPAPEVKTIKKAVRHHKAKKVSATSSTSEAVK